MNYKSKDSNDLDEILQENYWIEELDKSVVQLVFSSVNDKESFIEICRGN
jgi:hypothetical protein